jgi:DNA repair protein RadD
MQLRPYQQDAVIELFQFCLGFEQRGLVVLPTASGKTVIFAELVRLLLKRHANYQVLLLGHTQEIVQQNEDKLLAIWPEAPVGVFCAGLGRREITQVISASRDSMVAQLSELPALDLVIIDEAHLITPEDSGRYQLILQHAKSKNPKLKVLGFTATPFRSRKGYLHDQQGLNLFDKVVYHKRIDELTKATYLCPLRAVAVNPKAVADTSKVRESKQDFNSADLNKVLNIEALSEAIVADWHCKTGGKLATVFYAASLTQAKLLQKILGQRGYKFPVIEGLTPKADRISWLEQFEAGQLMGLINYGTLTTGWDSPRMQCIVMARPTLSPGLFLQVVGRGLRTSPLKTETLLLDYGDNLHRFGPIERVRPESEDRKRFLLKDKIKTCPVCDTLLSVYATECEHCTERFDPPERFSECVDCGSLSDYFANHCEVCGESFYDE